MLKFPVLSPAGLRARSDGVRHFGNLLEIELHEGILLIDKASSIESCYWKLFFF